MENRISIMDEDWDYLLVLDACRYDYFEDLYGDYFEGELRKIRSPGSETSEWCRKVFTEKYDDVVYVSGNPRINSRIEVKDFDASKHFHEVVDVWDWGWDKERGTVLPSVVNKTVLRSAKDYPNKRIIGHYMQPHAPYLELSTLDISGNRAQGVIANPAQKPFFRKIGSKLTRTIGQKRVWKIREFLGIQPTAPLYSVYREVGEKRLRKEYKRNLQIVLEQVTNLFSEIEGKVMITSDHGELLGEGDNFGHYPNFIKPHLVEVPWFRVAGVKEKKEKLAHFEKSKIKNKIRELKRTSKV